MQASPRHSRRAFGQNETAGHSDAMAFLTHPNTLFSPSTLLEHREMR